MSGSAAVPRTAVTCPRRRGRTEDSAYARRAGGGARGCDRRGETDFPRLAERAHPRDGGAVALGLLRIEPLRHGLAVPQPLDPRRPPRRPRWCPSAAAAARCSRASARSTRRGGSAPDPSPRGSRGRHRLPRPSIPTIVEIAKVRASQGSAYAASDPGVTTGPNPCMPPMSWIPSIAPRYRDCHTGPSEARSAQASSPSACRTFAR